METRKNDVTGTPDGGKWPLGEKDFRDIRWEVEYLQEDIPGHGMDHVDEVVRLSAAFARELGADPGLTRLTALLHDTHLADGEGKKPENARKIMKNCRVHEDVMEHVLGNLRKMGPGREPERPVYMSLDAMAVSDAELCEKAGARGILRLTEIANAKCRPFFQPGTAADSRSTPAERLLGEVLGPGPSPVTKAGRKEYGKRRDATEAFLRSLFSETGHPEWTKRLDRQPEQTERIQEEKIMEIRRNIVTATVYQKLTSRIRTEHREYKEAPWDAVLDVMSEEVSVPGIVEQKIAVVPEADVDRTVKEALADFAKKYGAGARPSGIDEEYGDRCRVTVHSAEHILKMECQPMAIPLTEKEKKAFAEAGK